MSTDNSTPLKHCGKCQQDKPATAEFFPFDKRCNNFISPCRACKNLHLRTKYAINPEPTLKRQREQYAKDPQTKLSKSHKRYMNDPTRWKEYGKKYHLAHKEAGRRKRQRRRAKELALPYTFTDKDWGIALDWFNGCCAYCGNPPSLFDFHPVLHQEHHIPLSRGGGYTRANIVPACQYCNFSKNDHDPKEWVMRHFGSKRGQAILDRITLFFTQVDKQTPSHVPY